jgi:hypothetical protein
MSLAYAGTGNVLKVFNIFLFSSQFRLVQNLNCLSKCFQFCLQVQKLLGICSEHLEKGETHQGPAVLGIALIAMAEELGAEMAVRSLERLLQYGEQNIRRAVPLALGILCISNPKVC